MPSMRSGRVDRAIGPSGKPITFEDLPPPTTRRWVARRKAELVAAVRGGIISLEDACARYQLFVEEFRYQCLSLTLRFTSPASCRRPAISPILHRRLGRRSRYRYVAPTPRHGSVACRSRICGSRICCLHGGFGRGDERLLWLWSEA